MQAGTIVGNLASAIGVTTEEAALVADLKAGSETAFANLIAQYHQPLYSLIARSLTDPADAADITQEVFIKVFRSIRGFHGESSLRTWLYRIAVHEASNQRRWWTRCSLTWRSAVHCPSQDSSGSSRPTRWARCSPPSRGRHSRR